jgi:hypothetical protein
MAKKAPKLSKTHDLQETAQDLPGAPQFSMPQAHNSLRLFVAMHYFM